MAKVFIGMPVYNGEKFISFAINSIRKQTFSDWVLFISDNASTDKTEKICKYYCNIDNRIEYIKQEKNFGSVANFKFVLDNANLEYFMWAAHDDVWLPRFLSSALNILKDKDYDIAFCNVIMIDSFGREIFRYLNFLKFTTQYNLINVCRFLLYPEPNLIYSVYRLDVCKSIYESSVLTPHWGSDICFILAALSRFRLGIDSRILFQKRFTRITDKIEKIDKLKGVSPCFHIFPIMCLKEHTRDILSAVQGLRFYLITLMFALFRILLSIVNIIKSSLKNIFKY